MHFLKMRKGGKNEWNEKWEEESVGMSGDDLKGFGKVLKGEGRVVGDGEKVGNIRDLGGFERWVGIRLGWIWWNWDFGVSV